MLEVIWEHIKNVDDPNNTGYKLLVNIYLEPELVGFLGLLEDNGQTKKTWIMTKKPDDDDSNLMNDEHDDVSVEDEPRWLNLDLEKLAETKYFRLTLFNCPVCCTVHENKSFIDRHVKADHPEWKELPAGQY